MNFSVYSFASRLFDYLLDSSHFPYMVDIKNDEDRKKHPRRYPLHLKQAIKEQKIITGDDRIMTFDIGSEGLELTHPYYHILQQAPTIRKRGKATKKTKGSQDKYDPKDRDYESVSFGGKTGGKLYKEYSRNVRGARNRASNVSHWNDDHTKFENKDSSSYYNRHYRYFDRILDNEVVTQLALDFGLKPARKEDTGLIEELAFQWGTDEATVVDVMNSFNQGEIIYE